MKQIWMYWENAGRGMPPFVQLCIETVRRNRGNAAVHLLDQNSVFDFLPDLRPEWRQLKAPAHKADYVRTRLALNYGGMWLDCDMAALGPLEPLLDIPAAYDFACQSIGGAIGCFVARPGCRLLEKITKAQDVVLDRQLHDFPWNGIGNDLLKSIGEGYPCYTWPEWTVDEIADGKVSRLLSTRETVAGNVDPHAVVFHFCGNILTPLLRIYARHQHQNVLHEHMLISRILRQALQIEEPESTALLPSRARLLDAGEGLRRKLTRLAGRHAGAGAN